MTRHFLRSFTIAVITFFLGGFVYYQTELEINLGLDTLFQLRGKRSPPPEVVVVAMDETSITDLNVWTDYTKWRGFHAKLIEELNRQGTALIVFDLNFIQPQPEHDSKLAEAVRNASNVLMTECVQRYDILRDNPVEKKGYHFDGQLQCTKQYSDLPVIKNRGNTQSGSLAMRSIPLATSLGNAALDHAPFYLADNAKNPMVREAWTFSSMLHQAPTLPVITWFYYLQHTANLNQFDQKFSLELSTQRKACQSQPLDIQKYKTKQPGLQERISSLVCSEDDTQYLDFYGPPRTLHMVSYSDVYNGKATDFKGKIAFVGVAYSENKAGKTSEEFYSPFTTNDTGQMFGVEIMATQFANLLEGRSIQCPVPPLLLILAFGLIVALVVCQFTGLSGIAATTLIAAVYAGFALWCFSRYGTWLPVAVPILIQLPTAWLISLLWSRRDLLKERQRILAFVRRVFPQWMSFLPSTPGQWFPDSSSANLASERDVYGLCLATDIEGYTEVARKHTPHQMWELLNNYYKVLGQPINDHKGFIADVAGDAMIAFWIINQTSPAANQRFSACRAALSMQTGVAHFNKTYLAAQLPTRIGIHEGDMTLGELNAAGSVQYRAIGDTVNTASRIQSLNKQLGTQILASATIAANLDDIIYRPVGQFLLVGVDEPIEIVEIFSSEKYAAISQFSLLERFSTGLASIRQGLWQEAVSDFQQLLDDFGYDGPSQFYLTLAKNYLQTPPQAWTGVVKLTNK